MLFDIPSNTLAHLNKFLGNHSNFVFEAQCITPLQARRNRGAVAPKFCHARKNYELNLFLFVLTKKILTTHFDACVRKRLILKKTESKHIHFTEIVIIHTFGFGIRGTDLNKGRRFCRTG